MSWDDVRLFLALVEHATMRAAAQAVGMNASTLSRRLRQLEAALGVALFERRPEGLVLTPAGQRVVPLARTLRAEAQRLQRAVADYEEDVTGLVRLSMPPAAVEYIALPVVPGLLRKHPGLRLELRGEIAEADLLRRDVDIALRNLPPRHAALKIRRLAADRYAVMGSAGLLERVGTLQRWDAAPWVGWPAPLGHIPMARWMTAQGITPRLVLNSFGDHLRAAQSGLGLVLCTAALGRRAGLLAAPMTATLQEALDALPEERMWLVAHEDMRHVPRIDAVWSYIVAAMEAEAAE